MVHIEWINNMNNINIINNIKNNIPRINLIIWRTIRWTIGDEEGWGGAGVGVGAVIERFRMTKRMKRERVESLCPVHRRRIDRQSWSPNEVKSVPIKMPVESVGSGCCALRCSPRRTKTINLAPLRSYSIQSNNIQSNSIQFQPPLMAIHFHSPAPSAVNQLTVHNSKQEQDCRRRRCLSFRLQRIVTLLLIRLVLGAYFHLLF